MMSEQRFWSKVNKTDSCWEWIAGKDKDGYGQFWLNNKTRKAHRFSYELLKSKIPNHLVIDHLCENKKCVNPEHLKVVTTKQNTLRGTGFTAKNLQKIHCPRGHIYDMFDTNGSRRCRQCVRIVMKKCDFKRKSSRRNKREFQ